MQQVIKGSGSLLQVAAMLSLKGVKSVLVIAGHHVVKEQTFRDLLQTFPFSFDIAHPPEGVLQVDVIPLLVMPDAVVAIGGGKVLDFAKGIIYANKKPVYFIAVPTTAGSGSEATPIAVFYSGKEKVSLDAPELLPQTAILDAALLKNLSPHQRAISGADAFAQCVESAWNVRSTPLSESYAVSGLRLLWQNLLSFCAQQDKLSDEKVLWGAHLSGKAIAHTRTTGPHALAYYLTAHFNVPHGQAVALTLPLFFLYNTLERNNEQLQKIYNVLQVANGAEAYQACRHLFKALHLGTTLTDLGLQTIDLTDWLSSVNQQRFGNNPVPFDAEKLKGLFQRYLY